MGCYKLSPASVAWSENNCTILSRESCSCNRLKQNMVLSCTTVSRRVRISLYMDSISWITTVAARERGTRSSAARKFCNSEHSMWLLEESTLQKKKTNRKPQLFPAQSFTLRNRKLKHMLQKNFYIGGLPYTKSPWLVPVLRTSRLKSDDNTKYQVYTSMLTKD